jgi:hypothetical protein
VIHLLPFLLVGAFLFFTLYFVTRRKPRAEGSSEALVEARLALSTLQVNLLPSALLERIFAKEDLEYVAAQAPKRVQKMFCSERKKIAMVWVDQVRGQIQSLRRFHRGTARFYARLSFRTELELGLSFAALLLACRALQVLMYVGGPYSAPRMVGATAAAAGRVCKISEESLAFLNSPRLAISDSSTGSAAA